MNRLLIGLKALRQLGLEQVSLNALYRFGLMTGHYKRTTDHQLSSVVPRPSSVACCPLFSLPPRSSLLTLLDAEAQSSLLAEADEIVGGRVRLFGADPVPLQLTFPW